MATVLERHGQRLAAVEELEAAVYRAGIAWAPAGRAAGDARAKLAAAQRRVAAAEMEFAGALRTVTQRDRMLGDDLARLGVDGLTREAVGVGGGSLIDAVLAAAKDLRQSRAEAAKLGEAGSRAQGESGRLWRDVLLALDALREVSEDLRRTVGRLLFIDGSAAPPSDSAEAVADACREALGALGAKT